jgi:Kef-type K+ transport system membrane component KefB
LSLPPHPVALLGAGSGERATLFVIQTAFILLSARLLGRLFERRLRLPGMLGELAAGILIGPFALGAIPLPGIGPLFAHGPEGALLSPELNGLATLGSLVLLFFSGLETDLRMFLRYSRAGSLVGIGGVVISFFAGATCAPLLGLCDSWTQPAALFLGAISTATSVGITARILSEKKKTSSPEGVTILAAAVLDDVLGILVLAIVLAMSALVQNGDKIRWLGLVGLGIKVILLWLLFTAAGIAGSRRLARGLRFLGSTQAMAEFALGLAFLLAGVMEALGLAMIIGAFIMGLSLSNTDLAHVVREHLQGAYDTLVPIFFCVMGLMIDFPAMKGVIWGGLVFTVVCAASKLIGCYLPARLSQFNHRGALRIGLGMIPRGEVALVIASLGLASGAVSNAVFSVAVMMTMLTTLLTPAVIARAFHGGSGVRAGREGGEPQDVLRLDLPGAELARFVVERIAQAFRNEEFFVSLMDRDPPVYQIRKEDIVFTLRVEDHSVLLDSDRRNTHIARFILLEEVLLFKTLSADLEKIATSRALGDRIVRDLFS